MQLEENNQVAKGLGKTMGDPVILSTGNLRMTETDLHIRGRGMDFSFTRTYRNGAGFDSLLGMRWDFNWNQKIVLEFDEGYIPPYSGPSSYIPPVEPEIPDNSKPVVGAFFYNGGLRIDKFAPSSTVDEWESADGLFCKLKSYGSGTSMNLDPPDYFELRSSDGTIRTFSVIGARNPFHHGFVYHLTQITDRSGKNTIYIDHEMVDGDEVYWRIDRIIDTYQRVIDFDYDDVSGGGVLQSITDFADRSVRFDHDDHGNLSTVTSPATAVYTSGKSVLYEYDLEGGENLRHNLERVVDGEEYKNGTATQPYNAYLVNEYHWGRVAKQTFGGTNSSGIPAGGSYLFIHEEAATPIDWAGEFLEKRRVLVIDPNGNATLTVFDENDFDRMTIQFTGRIDPDDVPESASIAQLVTVDPSGATPASIKFTYEHAILPLRTTDPSSYETRRDYNDDSLPTVIDAPGSYVEYAYDTFTTDRFQHGNLLREIRRAKKDGQVAHSDYTTRLYVYEPYFNQLRAVFDPRGFGPYDPPDGTAATPDRYRTQYYFDYQESDVEAPGGALADLATTWDIDYEQEALFGDRPPGTGVGLLELFSNLPAICDDDNHFSQQNDLNDSGDLDPVHGNVIRVEYPQATIHVDPAVNGPSFTSQSIVEKIAYNTFSLPRFKIDPRGSTTTYEYYKEDDPDGDGTATPPVSPPFPGLPSLSTVSGDFGGGFCSAIRYPESECLESEYDQLGRAVVLRNGRGLSMTIEHNELDQVLSRTDPKGYTHSYEYDWSNNLVAEQVDYKAYVPSASTDFIPPDPVPETDLGQLDHSYVYDILNQLIRSNVDCEGGPITTQFRYDKLGNRVLVLLPAYGPGNLSQVTSCTYDERNLAYESTRGGLSGAFRTACSHDSIPELHDIQDDAGISTIYSAYDPGENVISVIDGEQKEIALEYDGFNRNTKIRNALGHNDEFTYDIVGQRISTTARERATPPTGDPYDIDLSYAMYCYDEMGRMYETNELLFSRDLALDPKDGPLSAGDNYVTSRIKYDQGGNAVQLVDDNQVSICREFDNRNRLTKQLISDASDPISDPHANCTVYSYDNAGNLWHTEEHEFSTETPTTEEVHRSWHFYDELNRKTATVDETGRTQRFIYDSRGLLTFSSDPLGQVGSLHLEDLDSFGERPGLAGLQVAINDHGNTTAFAYDRAGRLLKTIRHLRVNGEGGNPLVSSGSDGTLATERVYDNNSQLRFEIDDNGNATEYEYDPLGRLYHVQYEDGTDTWSYYDRNDRVWQTVDANETTVTNSFDAVGNLLSSSMTDNPKNLLGITSTHFEYDGSGRVVTAYNQIVDTEISRVERSYDSLGRLLKERQKHGQGWRTVTAEIDGVGNLQKLTYPGGRKIEIPEHDLNRPTGILDTTNPADALSYAAYEYIGLGRVTSRTCAVNGPEGSELTIGYDEARRIDETVHQTLGVSGQIIDRREYAWDRASNKKVRTQYRDPAVGNVIHSYTYDSSYQLATSQRTVVGWNQYASSTVYSHDGVCNRETVTGGSNPGTYSMTHPDDETNRYTSTPFDDPLEYDANGNLTCRGDSATTTMSYDHLNRMVELVHPNSAKEEYRYDPFGRRIRRTLTGISQGGMPPRVNPTFFYYWGNQIIEERNSTSAITCTYVYGLGIDDVISTKRTSQEHFHHCDDMCSVHVITDGSGVVLDTFDYGDFGELLDPSDYTRHAGGALNNRVFFQGRELDEETGLYFFRNRYMDPEVGRFTTRDPLGMWGDAASFGNGYTFTGNNPWSFVDPFGLSKSTGLPYIPDIPKPGGLCFMPGCQHCGGEDARFLEAVALVFGSEVAGVLEGYVPLPPGTGIVGPGMMPASIGGLFKKGYTIIRYKMMGDAAKGAYIMDCMIPGSGEGALDLMQSYAEWCGGIYHNPLAQDVIESLQDANALRQIIEDATPTWFDVAVGVTAWTALTVATAGVAGNIGVAGTTAAATAARTTTTASLIARSEAVGGHLIARHVAKTLLDLGARLSTTRLRACSTFTSMSEATSAVSLAIRCNGAKITAWLASGGRDLAITAVWSGGMCLQRGASSPTVGTGVRVVLRRTAQGGWYIVTGYPTP